MESTTKIDQLKSQLAECKSLLAYKNDTANGFMNQVKKLQAQQEALKTFLRQRAKGADKDSNEWKAANTQEMAAYRSGEWFAYHNVENFLTGANYV